MTIYQYDPTRAQHHDREDARERLAAKLAHEREILARIEAEADLPGGLRTTFASVDPRVIIADAEWRLRWLDCAPEGANHQLAPMQDKDGVPCGGNFNENIGPCQALRAAYAARGLHPVAGPWFARREAGTLDAFAKAGL